MYTQLCFDMIQMALTRNSEGDWYYYMYVKYKRGDVVVLDLIFVLTIFHP